MPTKAAQLDEELAPGFSAVPGGIMYQVATDYPKQMANIMADYEARARDPRYNPFGESPDSPRRLEQELVDPFRATFAASQPQARAIQPRYFETGGDIVSIDPRTGKASVAYDTPEKNTLENQKQKLDAGLLVSEIKSLNHAKLSDPIDRKISGLTDDVIDAQIADKTAKLQALFTQPAATAAAPSVATKAPMMAFGDLGSELSPVLQPPSGYSSFGATNSPAPATRKYKVISVR